MRQIFEPVFWYAPDALLVVLAVIIFVRGLYKDVPYFTGYLLSLILQAVGFWILGKGSHFYRPFYWFGEVVSWVLGIAVVWEIYATLLKQYPMLRKLGTVLFWIIGVVLLLIALWTAYNAPGADVDRLVQGALTLERTVRIVQCGLLLALFIFSSLFGLSWKDQLFGIALGFAVYVCTGLVVVAVRAYTGYTQFPFYRYFNPASWDVALIIWTFYAVKQWRPPQISKLPKTELAAWNETLQELLHH